MADLQDAQGGMHVADVQHDSPDTLALLLSWTATG